MGITLTLPAEHNTLLLEVSEDGSEWTECFLLTPRRTYLGADTLPFVLNGLHRAVGNMDTNAPLENMEGHRVAYAFALHETYHTLYFTDDGLRRLLLWQTAKTSPVSTLAAMTLTPDQRTAWQHQLTAFGEQAALHGGRTVSMRQELAATISGAEALK